MDEVDVVLDRLVDELDRRGARILELESRLDEGRTITEARAAQED
jgi:hypothetical protein